MGGGAGDFSIFNHGGSVAEQEDPYAPMPLAEPMQATPFGGPLRATPVDSSMETPWYQQVGQSAATSVITSALTGMLPFNKGGKVCPCGTPGCPGCGKGYNDGSYVGNNMPGYSNDKSALYKPDIKRAKLENLRPLMASSNIWPASSSSYGGGYPIELQHPVGKGGYKEKIALKESEAKIKREDMKAIADVAVKMKGPLQQGE